MTWQLKVRGLVFGLAVLGALSLASGAMWVDEISKWVDSLF
jgi:hypothetical protein